MSSDRAIIWVSYSFVGFHSWPGASERRPYLADVHRHNFGVRVEMDVWHDNREVEFHDLLDVCQSYLSRVPLVGQSCEHMARHLLDSLIDEYPNRRIAVSVDEDGECGARIEGGTR